MRYSSEFIDEAINSYLRTKNISFVSGKYNINLLTLRKWVKRYESEKRIEEYAKNLASKAKVLAYFDEVKKYKLVAKKYDLPPNEVERILAEYREEILFLTPKYKEVKNDFLELLRFFSSAYARTKSINVLEKILLIEMYLGKEDDYLIEKYNPPIYLLIKVRQSL